MSIGRLGPLVPKPSAICNVIDQLPGFVFLGDGDPGVTVI